MLLLTVVLATAAFATGDATRASCGNEELSGFESILAECRAYELVTPSFKDGGASLDVEAISENGSRLIESSLSGFSNVKADPAGTFYESTRSASGWSTNAISPSLAEFPAQQFLAVGSDLTKTLWALHTPSQSVRTEDLYIREPDGKFVEVGPTVPPAASAGPAGGGWQFFEAPAKIVNEGASRDLSHVFFEVKSDEAPWPGDTTISNPLSQSLYEYVGTGNTRPSLVGLGAEGRLLSDCGTILGSIEGDEGYNADTYNAVSANGETVFFTAQEKEGCRGEEVEAPTVNEVYARIGQSPIDTVAISEPTEADCEECRTGTATHRQPAVTEEPAEFQGASEDGSKVFFMSSQELFAGNTGSNLYEYDFNNPSGQKVLQVSVGLEAADVQGVARVSEDGTHVYFVARGVLTSGNKEGMAPVKGAENLYLFERDAAYPEGRLAFVATLNEEADEQDWSRVDRRPVQATPDGSHLVFQSVADLTAGDTSTARQVFEYDASNEELVRVSAGESSYAAGEQSADTHSSSVLRPVFDGEIHPAGTTTHLAVSADGSMVLFGSGGALTRSSAVAGEAGAGSVYEYRSSGPLANGSVYLVSDGANAVGAVSVGMDPSGQDAYFETTDSLVPADVNKQTDVYDARTGGGFPVAPELNECLAVGDCQGQPEALPSTVGAGTFSQAAGGNLPPPPPAVTKKPLTRAQKLAMALKTCKNKPKRRRTECEVKAHHKYGPVVKKRKGRGVRS